MPTWQIADPGCDAIVKTSGVTAVDFTPLIFCTCAAISCAANRWAGWPWPCHDRVFALAAVNERQCGSLRGDQQHHVRAGIATVSCPFALFTCPGPFVVGPCQVLENGCVTQQR
jgi:hypothetical protein